MHREASRVTFLMCPFCVRELLTGSTTAQTLVPLIADSNVVLPRSARSLSGSCDVAAIDAVAICMAVRPWCDLCAFAGN
jgi:hypothetical protein